MYSSSHLFMTKPVSEKTFQSSEMPLHYNFSFNHVTFHLVLFSPKVLGLGVGGLVPGN